MLRKNETAGSARRRIRSADVVFESGPLQGMKDKPEIKARYEATLRDLDTVKDTENLRFYAAGLYPWAYLYLDRPYGVYSAWWVEADCAARTARYWRTHPDARPTYIYIPRSYALPDRHYDYDKIDLSAQMLDFVQSVCRCEIAEGETGYIVRVLAWTDL